MPRGPRIDFPGAIHHVYARGIERRDIFLDDLDRNSFLGRVGANLSRWRMCCSAWSLMPNHFHLLLHSDAGRLSSFMQCLLTGYSKYFNERLGRVGHLFQNRYMSPVVDKAGYFRDVVRYIHLNPLRSGIVRSTVELEEYPWTGHGKILHGGPPDWQDTSFIRMEFQGGDDEAGWRTRYRDHLGKTPSGGPESEEKGSLRNLSEMDAGLPAASSGSYEIFSGILHRLAASNGVPVEEVVGGSRKYQVVQVRRDVLRACKSELSVPIVQMAHWLGMKENAAAYLLKSRKPER
ncbi:MAG TPA: transposase [Candidatus Methylomirabilis sp.]|nr:transposase [Candidatus Methylomirabilis sp.]